MADRLRTGVLTFAAALSVVLLTGGTAYAATPTPNVPSTPNNPNLPGIYVNTGGEAAGGGSQAVYIIVLMTVLSVAPALLMLCTSFTKIAVVLSLTRNALGTPTIPPNQVLAGIAFFLSLFVMGPVLQQSYTQGIEPMMRDKPTMSMTQGLEKASEPIKGFMIKQTGPSEMKTMMGLSKTALKEGETVEYLPITTIIPAFVLSELKAAFIIGFCIFIPFLVIDLVVSSALMSMGMMMLPPVMISLPFKLLLFVMVDGWTLITTALVASYQ